jgi:hypothetical protein
MSEETAKNPLKFQAGKSVLDLRFKPGSYKCKAAVPINETQHMVHMYEIYYANLVFPS